MLGEDKYHPQSNVAAQNLFLLMAFYCPIKHLWMIYQPWIQPLGTTS